MNDKKLKEYRERKILKYLQIFFSFAVIVLESFALFQVISYLWGFIPFVLNIIVKYLLDKKKS